jgi:hypothetical protein
MDAPEEALLPGLLRVGKAGGLLARFDFSGRTGGHSYPCVSPAQQAKFQQDFREQLESIQLELARCKDRDDNEWLAIENAAAARHLRPLSAAL